jgi:hypothetical protein
LLVTGFDYGNTMVRKLPFTRIGDLAADGAAVPATGAPGTAAAPAAPASATPPAAAPRLEALVARVH